MSNFDIGIFEKLISELCVVKQRVLQSRALSKNSEKVKEYIALWIENYNAIVGYTKTNTDSLLENHKALIFSKIESWRVISLKCFEKLNCNIEIPENLDW